MSDFCNYSAGFMIDKNIQTGFNFDNSYINLPKELQTCKFETCKITKTCYFK